jgi:hypothetical protein
MIVNACIRYSSLFAKVQGMPVAWLTSALIAVDKLINQSLHSDHLSNGDTCDFWILVSPTVSSKIPSNVDRISTMEYAAKP